MGHAYKVDLLRLQAMHDAGASRAEMAAQFNVGLPAICKNLQKLRGACAQDIVLKKAEKINNKRLSAMERLNRAAKAIEVELDHIQGEVPKAKGGERKELIASQLAHLSEERKQITALVDVAKAFYSIEDVRQFQRIIIDVIGEIDKGVRDEILKQLREKRSARNVLGGDGFTI